MSYRLSILSYQLDLHNSDKILRIGVIVNKWDGKVGQIGLFVIDPEDAEFFGAEDEISRVMLKNSLERIQEEISHLTEDTDSVQNILKKLAEQNQWNFRVEFPKIIKNTANLSIFDLCKEMFFKHVFKFDRLVIEDQVQMPITVKIPSQIMSKWPVPSSGVPIENLEVQEYEHA